MFELFVKHWEVRMFMWCVWVVPFLLALGYFIKAVKWW
nr:MAG TPA: transmembrane adaptor [Caudoviricetes sp.]